jgi:two-component system, chemotaxis family, protein-glutamate methylesterase/glutaminase
MSERRIITVGASAGGVTALKLLVEHLPEDLPAAICIVLHVPSGHQSRLPEILNRARTMPAAHAADGERVQQGRIYIAPPDNQLMVEDGFVRVVRGPRENRQRPAIDPLFRSAARAYGSRAIGVILTGALDDGTAGLREIKERGGIAIVQDPEEAETDSMPRSALAHVDVDFCLPIIAIARQLVELMRLPPPMPQPEPASPVLDFEIRAGEMDPDVLSSDTRPGRLSALTCPECHGPLWEIDEGILVRYRCRVGHAFSTQTMLVEQAQAVERALWVSLRALEENATLARRLAKRSLERNAAHSAQRFTERAEFIESQADTLRTALQGWELPSETLLDEPTEDT